LYKTNLEALLEEGGKGMLENEATFKYVTELDRFSKSWKGEAFESATEVLLKVYEDRKRGINSYPNREYVEANKARVNISMRMEDKLKDLIKYRHVKKDPLKPFAWLVVYATYNGLSELFPEGVGIPFSVRWYYEPFLERLIGREVLSKLSGLISVYSPKKYYRLCKLAEDLRDIFNERYDKGKKCRNEFLRIVGRMYLELQEKEGTIRKEGSSIYSIYKPTLSLEEFVKKNEDLIRKVTPYNTLPDIKSIIEFFQYEEKVLREIWKELITKIWEEEEKRFLENYISLYTTKHTTKKKKEKKEDYLEDFILDLFLS
jgi:ribosomal protein S17E